MEPGGLDADHLRLGSQPIPDPADDELLLRVAACGVCRTDLQIAQGDLAPRTLPVIPGHQIVGTVLSVDHENAHDILTMIGASAALTGTSAASLRVRLLDSGRLFDQWWLIAVAMPSG